MRFSAAVSAALAVMLLGSATAASADSLISYTGLRGSLAFAGSISANTPPFATKLGLDTGGGASLFWGIDLPSGFDAELELLYRYMPLDKATVNGVSATLDGYGQLLAPMANVTWTAPVDFWVKPYIGAGIGYAWNDLNVTKIGGTSFTNLHDDDWRFAYNVMAGIVIPASRSSRVTLGYRWLQEDVSIDCGAGVHCSGNLTGHSIDIGYTIDL